MMKYILAAIRLLAATPALADSIFGLPSHVEFTLVSGGMYLVFHHHSPDTQKDEVVADMKYALALIAALAATSAQAQNAKQGTGGPLSRHPNSITNTRGNS
jgi:hypothetical protein